MSDEKPAMPPQPTTKEIPAADPVLVAIATLTGEVRGARADISLVSNDLSIVKDRVTVLETERSKLSGGVRQLSSADATKDALIAQLSTKVDALAKGHEQLNEKTDAQTAILVATADGVRKFVATPTVKIIGGVLFGIFSTYLAKHYGIELPK